MTHSYMRQRHDSFMCAPWLIHMCAMTHSYVWHDSFMCAPWLLHMCAMPHPCVWHDSFICVTWLLHMCDMTHSRVFHALLTWGTWPTLTIGPTLREILRLEIKTEPHSKCNRLYLYYIADLLRKMTRKMTKEPTLREILQPYLLVLCIHFVVLCLRVRALLMLLCLFFLLELGDLV